MLSSHEPIPLSEAFPGFDAKPSKARRRHKSKKSKSHLQRSTDYYNALVNVIQGDDSSSSEDDETNNPVARYNPVNGSFFGLEDSSDSEDLVGRGAVRGKISRTQCLEDQRLRRAGFVPSPDAPQVPRVPYVYSGGVQPGIAQRGPTNVLTIPPGQGDPSFNQDQRAGASFGNPTPHNPHPMGNPPGHEVAPQGQEYNASAADASRFPPLSTSVPYAALSDQQGQRLAVANAGYTTNDAAFASRRQNFISSGALGGGKSSSASELAFGNLSLTTPDGVIDPYEHGGGTGLPPPPPKNKAAPPMDSDMSLFDFSQDNLYPYTGYTDYAATYKNPYTGEVTQTYTLDLERYKTDVWKEVPTYELGKPNRKFTDWSGMGRLQRPLPKPGAEPNQYVMPTFDPTYGYADAQAARADTRERALRENFFTRDPGLAGMVDQGNWTGYVGLKEMGRYGNANQYSKKATPYAPDPTPYEIPQSSVEQAPYRVGMTAPSFYVSGRPDNFLDGYQAAEADVGNVVRPPQALDRAPNAMSDIPMPHMPAEVGAGQTMPYQPQATAGTGMHDSSMMAPMHMPTSSVDAGAMPQDALAQQGAVNVPMDVFGIPGIANPGIDASSLPQGQGSHFVSQSAFATNAPGQPQGMNDLASNPANPSAHMGTLVSNQLGIPQTGVVAPGMVPQGGSGVVPSIPLPSLSQIIDSGVTASGSLPQGTNRPSMGELVQNAFSNPVPQQGGDVVGRSQGIADAHKGMGDLVQNAFANPSAQRGGDVPMRNQGIADSNKGMSGIVSNAFGNPSAQRGGDVPNLGNQGIADAHKGMSGIVANRAGAAEGVSVGLQPIASDAAIGSTGVPNRGINPTGESVRMDASAPVHPGDFAQPTSNLHVPMSGPDVLALEMTAPDTGKMSYELKDGSHYRNATMNAEAFLQANWATDHSRARANEMAEPRNQGITMTNPVTEAKPALQMRGAENMLPPGPSQSSLHASNIAASQAFATATPLNMYLSDSEYHTDC